MIRPLEPAGGSRLPWKSLKDNSWMSMVGPFAAACDVPPRAAAPEAASAATATTLDSRLVRGEVMCGSLCGKVSPAVAGPVHANRATAGREDAWCNAFRAFITDLPQRRVDGPGARAGA